MVLRWLWHGQVDMGSMKQSLLLSGVEKEVTVCIPQLGHWLLIVTACAVCNIISFILCFLKSYLGVGPFLKRMLYCSFCYAKLSKIPKIGLCPIGRYFTLSMYIHRCTSKDSGMAWSWIYTYQFSEGVVAQCCVCCIFILAYDVFSGCFTS